METKFVVLVGATEINRDSFSHEFPLVVPKTIISTDQITKEAVKPDVLLQYLDTDTDVSYRTDLQSDLPSVVGVLEKAKLLKFRMELVFVINSEYDYHHMVKTIIKIREYFDHLLVYDIYQKEIKTSIDHRYLMVAENGKVVDQKLYDLYQLDPL